jgi:hypothetical protein
MWAALAMMAAVTMGPTGMTPADAVSAMESSRGLRIALWAMWLAGAAPAVRAALARPDLLYLRALPIAPAVWWACLVSIALLVQAPWTALHWAGGGALSGAAAGLGAAGASAALAMRARRPAEQVACLAAAVAIAFIVAAPGPDWLAAGAGAAALGVAIPLAWRRAPESAAVRRGAHVRIVGPAPIALAIYHAVALWRRDRGALTRGLLLVAAGGAMAGLIEVRALGSLAIAALTVTAAVFGLAAPLARSRHAASWLLDASGTAPWARALAVMLVLAAAGLLAGTAQAGLAQAIRPGDADRGVAVIVFGLLMAGAAVPAVRWADRPTGVDGTRVVVAAVLVTIAALGVLSGIAAAQG